MLRNVEFALLVTAAAAAATAAAADEEECKSCNEINGGGDDDGEPDTDSTSELSLLSDRYGEQEEASTCNPRRVKNYIRSQRPPPNDRPVQVNKKTANRGKNFRELHDSTD